MNQEMSLRKAYEKMRGQAWRYVSLMFLFVICSSLLTSQELINYATFEHPKLSLPLLILLLAFIVGRNTLLAALLKQARKQPYTKLDAVYSLKKTGMYLLSRLFLFGIEMALLLAFTLLYQVLGVWALPLYQIASVMTLSMEAFIIFAINDGVKNAFSIFRNSLKLWYHHCNEIAGASFALIAWTLLSMVIQNFMVGFLIQGADMSEWEMLNMAFRSESLFGYALLYLGLQIANGIITAFLLTPTYLLYAIIYESSYRQYYPIPIKFPMDVIEVDVMDQEES